MFWKKAFDDSIRAQLGNAYSDFCACFDEKSPVSVRINPAKYKGDLPSDKRVTWCPDGFYLAERPSFTLDPALHAGAYYVQEASSMFLDFILKSITNEKKGLKILDLCAAPGGKSTILSNYIGDDGLLVANEVIKQRAFIVKENLIKWGQPNVVITNHDPDDFEGLAGFFDIVLVDAPCSGEGLFRKDRQAAEEWSENNVEKCTGRQKRILSAASRVVAPGGFLIYSTCTYNNEENTGNAAWFTNQFDFQELKFAVDPNWNIVSKEFGYQFYPHLIKGEGFYISVFQNQNDAIKIKKQDKPVLPYQKMDKNDEVKLKNYLAAPDEHSGLIMKNGEMLTFRNSIIPDLSVIFKNLSRVFPISNMGIFKGKDLVPAHELAMRIDKSPELPGIETDKENALNFLRKAELTDLLQNEKFGWHLVRFNGYDLGWIKTMPGRINNYYPTEYRIRLK